MASSASNFIGPMYVVTTATSPNKTLNQAGKALVDGNYWLDNSPNQVGVEGTGTLMARSNGILVGVRLTTSTSTTTTTTTTSSSTTTS